MATGAPTLPLGAMRRPLRLQGADPPARAAAAARGQRRPRAVVDVVRPRRRHAAVSPVHDPAAGRRMVQPMHSARFLLVVISLRYGSTLQMSMGPRSCGFPNCPSVRRRASGANRPTVGKFSETEEKEGSGRRRPAVAGQCPSSSAARSSDAGTCSKSSCRFTAWPLLRVAGVGSQSGNGPSWGGRGTAYTDRADRYSSHMGEIAVSRIPVCCPTPIAAGEPDEEARSRWRTAVRSG